ncbi:hypothetical protein BDN72DRAFT_165998 [Pluteus cervinus]|uniref:Uncharacterized protein n=1 Tax=Pluteus cervinus TaxID=181527 RepID=A0ACD3B7C1_9AGAR|nr:hypothetical protein BDN72DRAFT_165998 [Pluteus cervinus]
MSVNHSGIATHVPPSLPSFAQAFSTTSLGSISTSNNALPPIQTRLSSAEANRVASPPNPPRSRPPSTEDPAAHRIAGKKRPRIDVDTSTSRQEDHSDSDRDSPLVRVKEEQEQDVLDSTPSPSLPPPQPSTRSVEQRPHPQDSGAPPPSSLLPSPAKKRRVTVSGGPHPLNTDVRVPVDQTSTTPISPVVIGFTIGRDNPGAIEQVRSMITVKQKQKALIEQRRGSVAGVVTPVAGPGNPPPSATAEDRSNVAATPKAPAPVRSLRRSPNAGTASRRPNHTPTHTGGNTRPPSPSPIIVPSQQPLQVPSQASSLSSIQTPSISFARRRANLLGPTKKKPADIVISPREAHTKDQFQPAIQSAPPVPHAGQAPFYSGRFPMTIPRLPAIMSTGENVRRVASNVPPTPTRLSMQRTASTSAVAQPISNISGRSPPAASVPISASLVPPTPSALHHPGYSGDKSAFLAPFEMFYDALNDSKQLKNWLGDQIQRSNSLLQSLTQQQDKINEVVESLVERRMAGMRSEVHSLRRRVDELEDALRAANGNQRQPDNAGNAKAYKGKQSLKNGIVQAPIATEGYTFPPAASTSSRLPAEPMRASPSWNQDRESRDNHAPPDSETGSPIPYDTRRLSISATRLDPPRSQPPSASDSSSQSRGSFTVQSPPLVQRDSPSNHALPPPPPSHGKVLRSSYSDRDREQRSGSHRQGLSGRSGGGGGQAASATSERSSPAPTSTRRQGSRRNSITMSAPEGSGDDT